MTPIPFVLTPAEKSQAARIAIELERIRREANARDNARKSA